MHLFARLRKKVGNAALPGRLLLQPPHGVLVGILIFHCPGAVAQAAGGGVIDDAENGQQSKHCIDQVQQLSLHCLYGQGKAKQSGDALGYQQSGGDCRQPDVPSN